MPSLVSDSLSWLAVAFDAGCGDQGCIAIVYLICLHCANCGLVVTFTPIADAGCLGVVLALGRPGAPVAGAGCLCGVGLAVAWCTVADAGCLCGVGLAVAWCTGCGCRLLVWCWPCSGLVQRLRVPVACVVLALQWPGAPVAGAGCLCGVGLAVAWCTGCGCRLLVWCWPWGGLVLRLRVPVACVVLALRWPGAPVAAAGCSCGVAWCTGGGCRMLVWCWPCGGLVHRLRLPVACVVLALRWPGAPVADAGCLFGVGLAVAWCTGCNCRLIGLYLFYVFLRSFSALYFGISQRW